MSYHGRNAARRNPSRHPDRETAPKSTAWLDAQKAFADAPVRPKAGPQPQVVVKRSRAVSARPQAESAPEQAAAQSSLEDKGPRIFRVESAPNEGAPAPVLPEETPVVAEAPRRKRRVDAHKRPGPVVVAFQAPTPLPQEADDAPDAGLSKAEVRALTKMLARLEPVFDDIRRAQAFQFIEAH